MFLGRNILRIRSVIKKPLTMFVNASATPTVAKVRMNVFVVSDNTMRAATKETDEIAFVKDIRGVCKSRDTCRISSTPRKVESMKMIKFTGRSARTWLVISQDVTAAELSSAFFVCSCITSPSFVTSGPRISSSSGLNSSLPSFKISRRKVTTFLE